MFTKEAVSADYMITETAVRSMTIIFKKLFGKNSALFVASAVKNYDRITSLMMADEGPYCAKKTLSIFRSINA